MRIAIDAMGGDRAPEEVVKGALVAALDFKVAVTLVGDETAIRKYLPAHLPDGIEVHHASEVIEMGAAPTQVRRKKDSSIAVATRLHKEGHAQAVLSAIWGVEDGYRVEPSTPVIVFANTLRPLL